MMKIANKLCFIIIILEISLIVGCTGQGGNKDSLLEHENTDVSNSDMIISAEVQTDIQVLQVATHTECKYCGRLEDGKRWFIAEVMESGLVRPVGNGCREKIAAGIDNIMLTYSSVDGFKYKKLMDEDLVRITYNSGIMESIPVQIAASSVETLNDDLTPKINQELHSTCKYCGELENGMIWFIGEVTESGLVIPLGTDCYEGRYPLRVSYSEVDGDTREHLNYKDVVRITYSGRISRFELVQIVCFSVETLNDDLTPKSVG